MGARLGDGRPSESTFRCFLSRPTAVARVVFPHDLRCLDLSELQPESRYTVEPSSCTLIPASRLPYTW